MKCTSGKAKTSDGTEISFIACGSHKRAPSCSVCRHATSTKLCDGPALPKNRHQKSKTCDRPLCDACAHPRGREKDYCPEHVSWAVRNEAEQGQLDIDYTDGYFD